MTREQKQQRERKQRTVERLMPLVHELVGAHLDDEKDWDDIVRCQQALRRALLRAVK